MTRKGAAQIYLTKRAVAERQLRAAIRMFFAGIDELAVQTVAFAAYRIVCDLKAKAGREEAADFWHLSIFYAVRDFRKGTLPPVITADKAAMDVIKSLAEELPITASSNLEDCKVTVSPDVAREFWDRLGKVPNFLKHADRDSRAHISIDEVDNLKLLSQALNAYIDLTSDNLYPEGYVFYIYFTIETGTTLNMPKEFHKMAVDLELIRPSERLRFCNSWLQEL